MVGRALIGNMGVEAEAMIDAIAGVDVAARRAALRAPEELAVGTGRGAVAPYPREWQAVVRVGEDGQRRPQNRGGKGLKGYNITAKTGRIAGVAIVDDADDIMLIENGGVLIRMAAADINIYGRDTQGVILMRLEAGSRVISVDRVDREPEEPAENQNPEPEISTPDGNDFV